MSTFIETERRDTPCSCGCGRTWVSSRGRITVAGRPASFLALPTRHEDERVAWIAIGDGVEPAQWVWLRSALMGENVAASVAPPERVPFESEVAPVLTREQVLATPALKARVFAVHDELLKTHEDLKQLFVPELGRDFSFQMPDCVFSQPKAQRSPRNQQNFAECGERVFVRALVGFPVSDGGELRIGVWVEVPRDQFGRLLQAWDEPSAYLATTLTGKIENSLELNGQNMRGLNVELAPRTADQCLFVKSSGGWLGALLETGMSVRDLPGFIEAFRQSMAAKMASA